MWSKDEKKCKTIRKKVCQAKKKKISEAKKGESSDINCTYQRQKQKINRQTDKQTGKNHFSLSETMQKKANLIIKNLTHKPKY